MDKNDQIKSIIKELIQKNWEISTDNYMIQKEIEKINQNILPQEAEMKAYIKQQSNIKKIAEKEEKSRIENIEHLKNRISLMNSQNQRLEREIEDLNLDLKYYQERNYKHQALTKSRPPTTLLRDIDI